jgi:hypothetical protein
MAVAAEAEAAAAEERDNINSTSAAPTLLHRISLSSISLSTSGAR